ncbi:MAG: VOC family protein [Candidatus Bathyarchaeia archaeon]|jgi:catechol 2,3-dioxygenase-like lactoylglutathione lyase family enzyme
MKIGHITLLVKNFDEALNFYVEEMGFQKCRDDKFGKDMRWVTVSPKDQPDLELTFVLADTAEKLKALGKQAGDHVFMTLQTDDCKRDYQAMKEKGVKFYGRPTQQMWGIEVVFEDLYGNLYDLIQRSKPPN